MLLPEAGTQQGISTSRRRRISSRWLEMVGLGMILVMVVVVEGVRGMLLEAIPVIVVVGVVVVVGGGISYLSLRRRSGGGGGGGGVSVGEAVFNWSVVALAAFTAFLFLIS
jgi:hypothetical protein